MFECPFCHHTCQPSELRPRGLATPVIVEKRITGSGKRLTRCPQCQSYDRERLVYLYLQRQGRLTTPGLRILHIAPEDRVRRVLERLPSVEYVIGDISPGKGMQRVDIRDIEFADERFDLIICNHVLEHVEEDTRALGELLRVLRTGGLAILQTPIALALESTFVLPSAASDEEREAAYGQKDHVRLYGRDFPLRVASTGFEVECFDVSAVYGLEGCARLGLNPEEALIIGHKGTPAIS